MSMFYSSSRQQRQNLDPFADGSKPWYLVNSKIAGKRMFHPTKNVSIGIDPYPNRTSSQSKLIELDDGTILTVKPDQFDGNFTMVSGVDFPLNQSNE